MSKLHPYFAQDAYWALREVKKAFDAIDVAQTMDALAALDVALAAVQDLRDEAAKRVQEGDE